jgi:hypothetical protein
MWQLRLMQRMSEIERQAAKEAKRQTGQGIASLLFGWELNKPEAYVDRMKREFNLRDYHQARALYESNPAYWEKLYGDDPVTSRNHSATAPSSLVPRQPPAGDPSYNLFDPSSMGSNALGPFGSGGRFVPRATTSSRPSDQPALPGKIDDSTPVRRLGARIGDTPGATVFDFGAPAVPFVSPNPIPRPGVPVTFDERFPAALPPTSAPGAASPDDLEAFRRQWIKAFMQP